MAKDRFADVRSPYFVKGQAVLRPSVVAFVDILGYQEMMLKAVSTAAAAQFLSTLRAALSGALQEMLDDERDGWDVLESDMYRVRVFTDNVVVGYPIHDDAESELGRVFSMLGRLQLNLALLGFFLRGGIAVGEVFMDELVVYGSGLVDAYKGESTLAQDPRVVLTESAVRAVKKHLNYYSDPQWSPQARDLLLDADGQFFLNYLDALVLDEDEVDLESLERHKEQVGIRLAEFARAPKIWSKYEWVARYHNVFCEQHQVDKALMVDVSTFQIRPGRIV